jgi:hypothetical protein
MIAVDMTADGSSGEVGLGADQQAAPARSLLPRSRLPFTVGNDGGRRLRRGRPRAV